MIKNKNTWKFRISTRLNLKRRKASTNQKLKSWKQNLKIKKKNFR